jgi:hypothetical protein
MLTGTSFELRPRGSSTIIVPEPEEVPAHRIFVQNLRRGLYELAVEEPTNRRVAVAFDELVLAI